MPVIEASIRFGIPYSTLRSRMILNPLGAKKKRGVPTILNEEQELEIVKFIQDRVDKGQLFTTRAILKKAHEICKKSEKPGGFSGKGETCDFFWRILMRFLEGPSNKWYQAFLKRNPIIQQLRKDQLQARFEHLYGAGEQEPPQEGPQEAE
jgi:hypothetical protein